MNWRDWIHDALTSDVDVTSMVPADRIFGSGSMKEPPADKPFIGLQFGPMNREHPEAVTQDVTVWVHDVPGSYVRIDEVIKRVKATLEGPVAEEDAVYAHWQGDSQDLYDEQFKTGVRTSSYRLAGRG